MEKDNNIEDWYRDELSRFEASPDADGWEVVSNQLDASAGEPITEENVDAWYVKELEKFEASPNKEVWNKLSAKLDVNNVWERLLLSLNKYERMIWWRNFSIQATAIALLLLGGYFTYQNHYQLPLQKEFAQNGNGVDVINEKSVKGGIQHSFNSSSESPTMQKAQNFSSNKESRENQQQGESSKKSVPVLTNVVKRTSVNSNIISSQKEANETVLLASNTTYFGKIKAKNARIISDYSMEQQPVFFQKDRRQLNVRTLESKEFLVKKEQNKIIFNNKRFSSHFVFGMYARRFYAGVNIGAKKQALITAMKDDSNFSNYQRKQLLDFGSSFGATVGFIVSDKLNVESNVNVLSSMGYQYNYTAEGVSFNEKLNMNYTTVSIMAKMMNNKSTFDNKKYSTNLMGGVYAGYLNSATSNINGTVIDQKGAYKKLDMGVVFGIEQDRYLTKELVITPGLRYYQGVLNTADTHNKFKASRTISIEFNVGVKYIFLKKG